MSVHDRGDAGADTGGLRAVTFVVTPPKSHPTYRVFGRETGLTRERIFQVTRLDDGTLILLSRLHGDRDRIERVLAEQSDVLDYSVSEASDGRVLLYIHARPPPPVARFLDLPQRHEVFIEFPMEGTRDGRLRVVMIGESNAALQAALADVPAEMEVTVERIGPYPGDTAVLQGLLTDRQREVLDVALDLGYYEVPRRATHSDIAERLDLSVGTVGEHLQKIEARVFGSLG
jgi:DNA-binding CsgD family transcriptional regulator